MVLGTLRILCVIRYGYFEVGLLLCNNIGITRLICLQTNNSYFVCDDPLVIDQIFARLRCYDGQVSSTVGPFIPGANPSFKGPTKRPSYPMAIAGLAVTSVVDLTVGYDSTNPPTYKPNLPLSSGHMIQFRAASKDGLKIVLTIRTSGTEPKVRMRDMLGWEWSISAFRQIKYYLEGNGQDLDAVQKVLKEVVRELNDEWMQASLNKLGRP